MNTCFIGTFRPVKVLLAEIFKNLASHHFTTDQAGGYTGAGYGQLAGIKKVFYLLLLQPGFRIAVCMSVLASP